jgi:hypothetical protein
MQVLVAQDLDPSGLTFDRRHAADLSQNETGHE